MFINIKKLIVIKEKYNNEGKTNSNRKIGVEIKQTKEYIFFSGTKILILFEYTIFYFYYVIVSLKNQ